MCFLIDSICFENENPNPGGNLNVRLSFRSSDLSFSVPLSFTINLPKDFSRVFGPVLKEQC